MPTSMSKDIATLAGQEDSSTSRSFSTLKLNVSADGTTAAFQITNLGVGELLSNIASAATPVSGSLRITETAGGTLQYSVYNGSSWSAYQDAVSVWFSAAGFTVKTSGADVTATGSLNWTPAKDANGTITGFTVGSSTAVGGTVDDTCVVMYSVASINDRPVLATSGAVALPDIAKDVDNAANTGIAATGLLTGSSVTDVDTFDFKFVYIQSADSRNGVWQYKVSAGAWTAIDFTTNSGKILLLSNADSLRFVPNANYEGIATITFGVWDASSGTAGSYVAQTTGATSAFSAETKTATIKVGAGGPMLPVQAIRVWSGTAWVDVSAIRRWDGAAWVDVPLSTLRAMP